MRKRFPHTRTSFHKRDKFSHNKERPGKRDTTETGQTQEKEVRHKKEGSHPRSKGQTQKR